MTIQGSCSAQSTDEVNQPQQTVTENSVVVEDKRLSGIVASWTFERNDDIDFDGWPESWERESGRDYPAYLPIRVVPHDPQLLQAVQFIDAKLLLAWRNWQRKFKWLPALPPSITDLTVGHYLRIDLNGGWAMVKSKKWPVDPLYRYRLELEGTCASLIHDHAWAELVFSRLNEQRRVALFNTDDGRKQEMA